MPYTPLTDCPACSDDSADWPGAPSGPLVPFGPCRPNGPCVPRIPGGPLAPVRPLFPLSLRSTLGLICLVEVIR